MRYEPVTLVINIFNKVENPIKYGDMSNCPYSHPLEISKSYNIINKNVKLQ